MCENDVEGVKRSLNSLIFTHVTVLMSKGWKEALTVLIVTHVTVLMSKGSKVVFVAYVHNTDTFNAMSKGSKDYVMLKQGTNTFLLITFLIFKQFLIRKKFWKAET